MKTIKTRAHIAGIFYLLLILFGIYAEFFVRANIIVPGDAALTAQNIKSSEFEFRIAFVLDLLGNACYFMLAYMLYTILRSTDENKSLAFLLLTSIGTAMLSLNLLNHFAAIMLTASPTALGSFTTQQVNELTLLFMQLQKYGYLVAQPFLGAWLLPLGYLIYKSEHFPNWLGIALIIACFGHLIDLLISFLIPELQTTLAPFVLGPAVIGEFSLCLWLLIKGVRLSSPAKQG